MLRSAETIPARRTEEEPPYTRYALLSPANVAAMVSTLAVAAATGEPWIAVCGAAAETVWLLLAPGSELLRRRWFDRVWAEARKAEEDARLRAKVDALDSPDQARVAQLLAQRARIEDLSRENPSFATSLVKAELTKLGSLVEDFVDLAELVARSERHLETFDVADVDRARAGYAAQVEAYPARDPRHVVATRNLGVLDRRRERHEDLARAIGTARGQMDLIENTFRLLADEIVTMVSPSELGQRLDDLRIAVDAIRETVREGDYEGVEEEGEPRIRQGEVR